MLECVLFRGPWGGCDKALERPINIVLILMYGTLKRIIRGLICMIRSIKRPKHGA